MTTTPERVISVDDYQHPEWCDLARCEPISGIQGFAEGCHTSVGTWWGVQADEAAFTVGLVLSDDFVDGANHGSTRVKVQLSEGVFGKVVDAWLDAPDARILATILERYADRADRANRVPLLLPAGEIRGDQESDPT